MKDDGTPCVRKWKRPSKFQKHCHLKDSEGYREVHSGRGIRGIQNSFKPLRHILVPEVTGGRPCPGWKVHASRTAVNDVKHVLRIMIAICGNGLLCHLTTLAGVLSREPTEWLAGRTPKPLGLYL